MFTDEGDRILATLSELVKSARADGLLSAEEALCDALLTVFAALSDDCQGDRMTADERPMPEQRPLH